MKREREIVSVIIPVYNNADYVEKCIRSVMNQSWRNLDIIVVDDGSSDGSEDILDKLAAVDNRIRLVHQDNHGVAAARNKGLELAQGQFLTFVDGDDYIDRNYIQRLLRRQRETGAELVICGLEFVDKEGHVIKRIIPKRYERFQHEEWPMMLSAVCSHLYKRELWNKSGIRFSEGERGEDMPISLYFAAMCDKISVLSSGGYAYVQHKSSAAHRFRGLREYRLPYKGMEEVLLRIRSEGLKNDQEFHEVFVMRILALCLFSLARGASSAKKRELCRFIQHVLRDYIPDYSANKKTRLFSGLDFPLNQRLAIKIFVLLANTKLLYPFSLMLVC